MPAQKGELHEITITGMAHGGYGVGRIDGQVCFVPQALEGDHLTVQLDDQRRGVLWGTVKEVLVPSPARIPGEKQCAIFGACGGCSWLHFAYPAQAEWKQRIVADSLKRLAGIDCPVAWRENADMRLGYRTRAMFHYDGQKAGFYAEKTNRIVPMDHCPLCHPRLNEIFQRLKKYSLQGTVEITVNPDGEESCIHSKDIRARWGDLAPGAVPQFILDGVPILPRAFSQSSLILNRMLVQVVTAMADGAGTLLDLYCGNGNLSLGLSNAYEVTGMDHNETAVNAATSMKMGTYLPGNEKAMSKLLVQNQWNTVILDPPRTGAKEIAGALARASAKTLIYVSCDPATLARDLKALLASGWHVKQVVALDMFPNTAHVETVCQLIR